MPLAARAIPKACYMSEASPESFPEPAMIEYQDDFIGAQLQRLRDSG